MEYPRQYFKIEQFRRFDSYQIKRIEKIRLNNKKKQKPLNLYIPNYQEEEDLGMEGNKRLGCQCVISKGVTKITY